MIKHVAGGRAGNGERESEIIQYERRRRSSLSNFLSFLIADFLSLSFFPWRKVLKRKLKRGEILSEVGGIKSWQVLKGSAKSMLQKPLFTFQGKHH